MTTLEKFITAFGLIVIASTACRTVHHGDRSVALTDPELETADLVDSWDGCRFSWKGQMSDKGGATIFTIGNRDYEIRSTDTKALNAAGFYGRTNANVIILSKVTNFQGLEKVDFCFVRAADSSQSSVAGEGESWDDCKYTWVGQMTDNNGAPEFKMGTRRYKLDSTDSNSLNAAKFYGRTNQFVTILSKVSSFQNLEILDFCSVWPLKVAPSAPAESAGTGGSFEGCDFTINGHLTTAGPNRLLFLNYKNLEYYNLASDDAQEMAKARTIGSTEDQFGNLVGSDVTLTSNERVVPGTHEPQLNFCLIRRLQSP